VLRIVPRPAGRVCVAHSIPRHAVNQRGRVDRIAGVMPA